MKKASYWELDVLREREEEIYKKKVEGFRFSHDASLSVSTCVQDNFCFDPHQQRNCEDGEGKKEKHIRET